MKLLIYQSLVIWCGLYKKNGTVFIIFRRIQHLKRWCNMFVQHIERVMHVVFNHLCFVWLDATDYTHLLQNSFGGTAAITWLLRYQRISHHAHGWILHMKLLWPHHIATKTVGIYNEMHCMSHPEWINCVVISAKSNNPDVTNMSVQVYMACSRLTICYSIQLIELTLISVGLSN